MGKKGPTPLFKPHSAHQRTSLLRDDSAPAARTQSELNAARQNARAAKTFAEALATSLRANKGDFGECPIAADANRTGKPPARDVIPATNASSLYNSTVTTESSKR